MSFPAELLEWVKRIIGFIPVFQQLWSAVKDDDADGLYAAQMELVRQIRGAQAREEFILDDPDEVTSPGDR